MTRLKDFRISAQKLCELFDIDEETLHRWNREGLKYARVNRKSYSLKKAFDWYRYNKTIPLTDFDFDALIRDFDWDALSKELTNYFKEIAL